jgi:hypothetical protein
LFGVVDLVGSFAGFDLWGTLGIQLPEMIWKYSSYIEIAIGYGVMSFFSSDEEESE